MSTIVANFDSMIKEAPSSTEIKSSMSYKDKDVKINNLFAKLTTKDFVWDVKQDSGFTVRFAQRIEKAEVKIIYDKIFRKCLELYYNSTKTKHTVQFNPKFVYDGILIGKMAQEYFNDKIINYSGSSYIERMQNGKKLSKTIKDELNKTPGAKLPSVPTSKRKRIEDEEKSECSASEESECSASEEKEDVTSKDEHLQVTTTRKLPKNSNTKFPSTIAFTTAHAETLLDQGISEMELSKHEDALTTFGDVISKLKVSCLLTDWKLLIQALCFQATIQVELEKNTEAKASLILALEKVKGLPECEFKTNYLLKVNDLLSIIE